MSHDLATMLHSVGGGYHMPWHLCSTVLVGDVTCPDTYAPQCWWGMDVTCPGTYAPSHLGFAGVEAGSVATEAEHHKRTKYQELDSTYLFFETSGTLDPLLPIWTNGSQTSWRNQGHTLFFLLQGVAVEVQQGLGTLSRLFAWFYYLLVGFCHVDWHFVMLKLKK